MTQVKMLKKVGKHDAGSLQTLPDREAGKLIADKSAVLVQQFWTNEDPKVDDVKAADAADVKAMDDAFNDPRNANPIPLDKADKPAKRK